MRSTITHLLAGVLLLTALPALAEETKVLPDVAVKSERPVTPLDIQASGNVEPLDISQEAKPVISTVPDILDHTPGVDVQRMSTGTPKNSQIKLRGLDEGRYQVYLDGRPLNGTGTMGGYYVDWSALPLGNWSAIEVSKGAYNAKYGNTLGGYINLVPQKPSEQPEASLSTGYKTYNTFAAQAKAGAKEGQAAISLASGYDSTDGNLRNSGVERQNYAANLYYLPQSGGEVRGSVRYIDGRFHMPVENRANRPGYDASYPASNGSLVIGPGVTYPSGDKYGDGSYYTMQRLETELVFRRQLLGLDSEAILYHNREDRNDVLTSFNQGGVVLKRDCVPDESWGWVTNFKKSLGNNKLGFGLDGAYQGDGGITYTYIKKNFFTPVPANNAAEPDASRRHGIYLDNTWSPLANLDIYGGLRADAFSADESVSAVAAYKNGKPAAYVNQDVSMDATTLLPKAGLVYRPSQTVNLFARGGRATRFPTIPEFYWYYAGYRPEVDPSSKVRRDDLTYEDAWQAEAGFSLKLAPATVTLTYFNYRIDNYIRIITGYAPSRVVYNIDRVDIQGLELALERGLGHGFQAFANLTYQQSQKQGDVMDGSNQLSDKLTELPEFKGNLGLRYQHKDGAEAKAVLRIVGQRQTPVLAGNSTDGAAMGSAVQMQDMGAYATVDLLAKYPLARWRLGQKEVLGFVSGGVENLLDRAYEEEYGFPAPGRVFGISLELRY